MTHRQKYLLQIMEHCLLNADFCDNCLNEPNGYESCRAIHKEFIDEARRSWEAEENDHGEETNGEPAHPGAQCQGAAQH